MVIVAAALVEREAASPSLITALAALDIDNAGFQLIPFNCRRQHAP